MPGLNAEGVILKRRNFGEADRMIISLTKQFGKISIVAKGVRRITSRRSGNVEVLNRVRMHLFKAKNYTLTEAESISTYQNIKSNLTLSTSAFSVIEMVDRFIAEDQNNPFVYQLLISILELLDKNPRQIFLRAFEVKLLSATGFWSKDALPHLDPELLSLLQKLEESSWNQVNELLVTEEQSKNLEIILRAYMEKILETSLKSVQVMKQFKKS